MTKYIALSTIFFSLILGFQNCGQPGALQSAIDQSAIDTAGTSPETSGKSGLVNISPGPQVNHPAATTPSEGSAIPSLAAMEVMTPPTMSTDPNGTMNRVEGQNLHVDLKTGEITELSQDSQPVEKPKRCLTANDLSILTSIFASARLCEGRHASTSETMCAMIYKMPYARLHSLNGEAVDLGESRSSCDHGPDLCGANQDLLKVFITNLLSHLNEKACAN